jgi:hypothetical protein
MDVRRYTALRGLPEEGILYSRDQRGRDCTRTAGFAGGARHLMWTVNQKDFLLLRDGGGQPFTGFVDGLIRIHGYVYGVGEAEILTSLRTSIEDGGVDTQARRAFPGDPTGYLLVPTCWQYKAQAYKTISGAKLLEEIHKRYAKELIGQGYGYRLAICDDMPPEKQAAWENLLTEAAREIHPAAPEARVATASQLASWANAYPPLLPKHFPHDPGPVLYFEAWRPSITIATPEFVPVEAWRGPEELLRSHINLQQAATDPAITLQGVAGVGKTRLVYEILKSIPQASQLVFYTADGDDAEKVSRELANDPRTRGILVADECPVTSRVTIYKILKGHTSRIRVICIDNSGEHTSEQILWLDQLSPIIVAQVLARNFHWVPADRRRLYAEQSGGYIRLAADMCEHDTDIQTHGDFAPALNVIEEYYRQRLPEDRQQRAVETIALMQKVGFGEGVNDEIEALCAFTGQNREDVLDVVRVLKDAPGFVARTTRYVYVTPEIIAKVAFARGWRRWFEPDPVTALRRLPPSLIASFQSRVARSASAEVRTLTGKFFWNSIASLSPSDLADEEVVQRVAVLIDTNPDLYFPQLAGLVARASKEELLATKGGLGQPGSRRQLVVTAEHLAAFPEYFSQAEALLRRLALAETENRIGNNATGVWKNLFRIVLSGAATRFSDRIGLLEKLLFSPDPDENNISLLALEQSLDFVGTRLVGPSIMGGKLVPPDWRPGTKKEFQDAVEQVLRVFSRVLAEGDSSMQDAAWKTLTKHLRSLLGNGLLAPLQGIYEHFQVPPAFLSDSLEGIEDFLHYECGGKSGQLADDPYCRDVERWLAELTPRDFDGQLKAVVGKEPWHHSIREDLSNIPSEIKPLAEELVADPEKFRRSLPYLSSNEARSAGLLGDSIAKLDTEGRYLDAILGSVTGVESLALTRGYVSGLASAHPEHSTSLNRWLDRLEKEAPEGAYFLALCAPDSADPVKRTLRLVQHAKISVHSFQNLLYGPVFDRMSPDHLVAVLDLLVRAGDAQSLHIAVDFIGHAGQKHRDFSPSEREAVWRVLKASAPVEDRADYWWVRAVSELGRADPERACDVTVLALTGNDYEKRNHAWDVLSTIAMAHPDLVMEKVGAILVDPEQEWRLRVSARGGLFQTLPFEAVQRWLEKIGLAGARAIANQLQPPFLDTEGSPQVSLLTAYVLERWGEDEFVYSRFAAATHHLQMYSGDIAATHRKEADRARPFLSHPIAAIRKWAEDEVALGEEQARQWTIRNEELFLE